MSSAYWTRPEHGHCVSSIPTVSSCAAKCVKPGVLRVLVNVVRLDRLTSAEDELHLILKFDAARLKQRQSSHVDILARTKFSFVMLIGWTTVLEILGANKPMHMVLALQMASCCRRCLYCGVGCT